MPRRRTAFILKGYPRLSETFIAQEIHLLEQRGFDIVIYSMRGPRESKRQPINGQIRAPVVYLPEYFWPNPFPLLAGSVGALWLYPSHWWGSFLHACAKSFKLFSTSPLKRFLQAGWLVWKQKLGQPQGAIKHLHSHFVHSPTELAFYASRISALTYSISAHAKDIYLLPKEQLRERVNSCELIMTCTKANYDFLRTIPGITQTKIHLVYHGIDINVFSPDNSDAAEPEDLNLKLSRLLSVGRLVEKKGYDVIFSALAQLKEEGQKFTYDIYGAGELRKPLFELRDQLGLQTEIMFHDSAVQPEIADRLNRGGIFLCGSKITADGDRDGVPNTIAEAMAMEVPVLATNVSGIPELIEDGVSGRLVESQNPSAFADALKALLSNPEGTAALGRRARERVKSVFDSRICIERCARLMEPFK